MVRLLRQFALLRPLIGFRNMAKLPKKKIGSLQQICLDYLLLFSTPTLGAIFYSIHTYMHISTLHIYIYIYI